MTSTDSEGTAHAARVGVRGKVQESVLFPLGGSAQDQFYCLAGALPAEPSCWPNVFVFLLHKIHWHFFNWHEIHINLHNMKLAILRWRHLMYLKFMQMPPPWSSKAHLTAWKGIPPNSSIIPPHPPAWQRQLPFSTDSSIGKRQTR